MKQKSPLTYLLLSALLTLNPVCSVVLAQEQEKNVLAPAQDVAMPSTKVEDKQTQTGSVKKDIQMSEADKKDIASPKASPSISVEKKLEELAKQQAALEAQKKELEAAKSKLIQEAKKDMAAKRAEAAKKDAAANLRPVSKKVSAPAKKSDSMKLFGRIEQISKSGDVKMPVLKAMTAKLDPRGRKLQAKVEETKYSGTIAKNFPTDFRGQWGGSLQVWSYQYSPLYLKVDRAQAVQSVKILKKGRKGNVNFNFYRDRLGKVALRPAEVLLSIPMKDSYTYGQMMKSNSGMQNQMAPFGKSFENVMANMEVPMVKINFGNAQTDGVMTTGISGNQFKQVLVKNVIRQLAPNVIEQQIVTRVNTRVKGKNKTNSGYAESVLRFKKLNTNRLYVLAASVNYTKSGKYLDKMIMYGTVDRGRLVQTDPMSGMNQMMGNMMNLQGLGKMFGMPTNSGSRNSDPRLRGGTQIQGFPNLRGGPQMLRGNQNLRRGNQIQGMPQGFDPYEILKRMNQQGR